MLLIPGPTRKLRPDSKPRLAGDGGRKTAVLNCRYGSLLFPDPGSPVIRHRLVVSVAEPARFVVALTFVMVQVGVYGVPLCNT